MNINYNKEMEKLLEEISREKIVPELLLHSCCAPCSSAVIERLAPYFNISILYYNPNIEPYDEYLKRKEEQIKFIQSINVKNKLDIIDCDYDNEKYHELVKNLEQEKEGEKDALNVMNYV